MLFINLAGVAQSAEQVICNHQVGGSNPSASCVFLGGVPKRPKGADCKSAGLTPSVVQIHPPPNFKKNRDGCGAMSRLRVLWK